MSFYLALDGGGTKTTCVVADEAAVLGTATAGGSNIVRLGEAAARASLRAAVEGACAAAHLDPAQMHRTVIGIAGASVPEYSRAIRRILGELVGGEIEVVGDHVIALEAAFAGLPGIIVIAGTGSIAFGRNPRGQTARAGGYGWAISDEGSAHWIGARAIRVALRAHDSDQPGELLPAILQAWQLRALDELVQKGNAQPRPDFAQLFPVVTESARRGDPLATEILCSAGIELARLAGTVIARLWNADQAVRVAIGGGVFQHSAVVRQSFHVSLRTSHSQAALSLKITDPVAGALWLARNRVGVPTTP